MCLVAVSIAQHPRFVWLLASNRDEFFDRPSTALAWWRPAGSGPQQALLSGRDLVAGGTWLGLDARGRLALVTNVREPGRHDPAAASRGALVLQALQHGRHDAAWLRAVVQEPRNGYNLLVADLRGSTAAWTSNRTAAGRTLHGGLHGLSNALLDTPWPKVQLLKQRLARALDGATQAAPLIDAALAALADRTPADDAVLPRTGLALERERQLSPAFIRIAPADDGAGGAASYGTRCSTVVLVEQTAQGRQVQVVERRHDAAGAVSGTTHEAFVLD